MGKCACTVCSVTPTCSTSAPHMYMVASPWHPQSSVMSAMTVVLLCAVSAAAISSLGYLFLKMITMLYCLVHMWIQTRRMLMWHSQGHWWLQMLTMQTWVAPCTCTLALVHLMQPPTFQSVILVPTDGSAQVQSSLIVIPIVRAPYSNVALLCTLCHVKLCEQSMSICWSSLCTLLYIQSCAWCCIMGTCHCYQTLTNSIVLLTFGT